ncbi:M48 family metalloprotease [Streptomyces lavendulae]|uniref:Uncharacterized protein n=1 Tax=Streptomyces lavendulae subsp. lavendulae TaxID=58340 RepID=A0A2K8P6K3_STRLA|nr:M48 family metalloprotease [Streptomyces lavendulae]ATZ22382.1 hypothetical protein SLAV_02290 [Streptomyces lavendulae subsp. lavendulae]QUQ52226.1 hypothetical protein SLLC_00320 [Streptomyces lavendulae subsp. lavendulae]
MLTRLPRLLRSGVIDTGLRFVLLITLAVASSVAMLNVMLKSSSDRLSDSSLGCFLAAGMDPSRVDLENLTLAGRRYSSALDECLSRVPPSRVNAAGLVIAVLGLVVAAVVVYVWLLPRFRDARTRPVDDATLAAELAELSVLSEVGPGVRFREDPTRTTAGAVAYGRAGRYTVCLHTGLIVRRASDPDGFRAVVLHELAHIRNHDVDFAYGSTALWRACVVVALLPYLLREGGLLVISLLDTGSSPLSADASAFRPALVSNVARYLLSGLLLVAIVHLARANLLRRRELHADLQAVSWGANPAAWDHPDPSGPVAAPLRRLTTLLRTHPDWAERRRVLARPGRMSDPGSLEMLLVGVAAWLLVRQLNAAPGLGGSAIPSLLTALLAAPALVLVPARSTRQGSGPGVRAGLWLGVGLAVGVFVVGGNTASVWLVGQPQYMVWLVLVAVVPAVWSAQFHRMTLTLKGAGPRAVAIALNFLATLFQLWAGLLWWEKNGSLLSLGYADNDRRVAEWINDTFTGPWQDFSHELSAIDTLWHIVLLPHETVPGIAALMMSLVPLLPYVRGRRVGLRLRRMLATGFAGGLLCALGFLAVAFALRSRRPAAIMERAGAYGTVLMWGQMLALCGACAITAAMVAGVSRSYWLLRALLATQVLQYTAYAALYLLGSADGCLGPSNMYGNQCHWIPANGLTAVKLMATQSLAVTVFLSAFAALAGAGLGRAIRRLRLRVRPSAVPRPASAAPPHPSPSQVPPPPGRRTWRPLLRRSAVLALGLPGALLGIVAQTDILDPPRSIPTPADSPAGLQTPPPARTSAEIQRWQARAWLTMGGLDRDEAIGHAFGAIGDALTSKTSTDEQIHQLCGDLDQQISTMQKFFPIPLRDIQQTYSQGLRRLQHGSQDCKDALSTSRGAKPLTHDERVRLFDTSLDEMEDGVRTAMDAMSKLAEIVTKQET